MAEANGKWVVDFGDDRCLASRGFLLGDKQIAFGLQPQPTTGTTRVFVQAPRRLDRPDSEDVEISVGSERVDATEMLVEPVVLKGHVRYSFTLDAEKMQKLSEAGQLSVDAKAIRVSVPLTNYRSISKLLDQCVSGLLVTWGLSAEAQGKLTDFPKQDEELYKIFNTRDYPMSAIQRGAIGTVEAMVSIDAAGKAVDCRIIGSTGHNDLDRTTCKVLLARARFEPARDRDGKPMASPTLIRVRWDIP